MERIRSYQENFWAGEFGNSYVERNSDIKLISSNIALFTKILQRAGGEIDSICELGANIGLNLIALHSLLPDVSLTGVEINEKAFEQLAQKCYIKAIHSSLYEIDTNDKYDFVFTKGVLIHQSPSLIEKAYDVIYQISNRYIMLCEYYNPTLTEVNYRGNKSVLFKRDFAGELLDRFPDLQLIDYGFVYHKDNHFPGDDFTWFLLEK